MILGKEPPVAAAVLSYRNWRRAAHWNSWSFLLLDTAKWSWAAYNGPYAPIAKHTYLAQGKPWSLRRFPQGEAWSLHTGWADLCDHPKCGWLGCVIYVSGGLRSRYPLIYQKVNCLLTQNCSCFQTNTTWTQRSIETWCIPCNLMPPN